MGDIYEECGGEMQGDFYENPADEQRAPPPGRPAKQQPPPPQRAAPPKKPGRPVTTVFGDQSPKATTSGPWAVPLRSTGKLDDAREQHRKSIRSMPPQTNPMRSASNAPLEAESASAKRSTTPSGVPAGLVAGGFRLPAASFMSANKPPHLRKTDRSGDVGGSGAATKTLPPGMKPPPTSKPSAKPKPPMASKPSAQTLKPSGASKPHVSPPPIRFSAPAATTGTGGLQPVLRDSVSVSASTPPPGPRTPVSPTPSGGTTMASRFRRCPLKPADTRCPPPVPASSKPKLPAEGGSLRPPAVKKPPSPATAPHLANDPLRVSAPLGKTGNSPLPPRPSKPDDAALAAPRPATPADSPMPGRPPKSEDSPPPRLPQKPGDVGPGRAKVQRSSSRASNLPRQHSPPSSPPPPPVATGGGSGDDEEFDDVAEEDLYMPPMDEPRRGNQTVDAADVDLADDVDDILDSMGGSNGPLSIGSVPPPPPSTDPYPDDEEEVIEEGLYDDVENLAQEVLANKAREQSQANSATGYSADGEAEDPVYEVEGEEGLPPPAEDLYDDVPCAPGGGGEIPEAHSEDEHANGIDQSGSFSDMAADSTDEWSHEEVLDDDPSPLPPSNVQGQMPGDGGQLAAARKRKLSKRTKKRIRDEEKQKLQDEKKAKEDARRREREEREAAKVREREAKEKQKREAERQKMVEKQRKHHKIGPENKPRFLATAKTGVRKAGNHYLLYNAGEVFNVLFHEPDKQHKLPSNAWLAERQLDEQVGFVVSSNMQVAQQNADADELEAECLYEDVGQGSAVATAAFTKPTSAMGKSMPPPTVRAPPVPTALPTESEEECLYEDLPN